MAHSRNFMMNNSANCHTVIDQVNYYTTPFLLLLLYNPFSSFFTREREREKKEKKVERTRENERGRNFQRKSLKSSPSANFSILKYFHNFSRSFSSSFFQGFKFFINVLSSLSLPSRIFSFLPFFLIISLGSHNKGTRKRESESWLYYISIRILSHFFLLSFSPEVSCEEKSWELEEFWVEKKFERKDKVGKNKTILNL